MMATPKIDICIEKYREFIAYMQETLNEKTVIKTFDITLSFFIKYQEEWIKKNFSIQIANILHPSNASDLELYQSLKKEVESIDPEAKNLIHPESWQKIARMQAAFKMPFGSKEVQEEINTYREAKKKEKLDGGFAHLKEQCLEVFKKFKDIPEEARLSEKEVKVVFYKDEKSSTESTVIFNRKYEHSCNTCEKWETNLHKLMKCGACLKVWYCNADCQKADWKAGHKITCKNSRKA